MLISINRIAFKQGNLSKVSVKIGHVLCSDLIICSCRTSSKEHRGEVRSCGPLDDAKWQKNFRDLNLFFHRKIGNIVTDEGRMGVCDLHSWAKTKFESVR